MPPTHKVILNMDRLLKIEREAPGRAAKVVQKLAQDCEAKIKNSFSAESPSAPGEPPGVDTGTLKNSIIAEPGDSDLTWVVHDGVEYGVHLEYGTEHMAARPFFLPALEKIAANAPKELIVVVGEVGLDE